MPQHKAKEGATMTVVYTNEMEKVKSALAEVLGHQHGEELWPLLELV